MPYKIVSAFHWYANKRGKGDIFSVASSFTCKHFVPFFNIMSAYLIHKRATDLHLIDSHESL